MFRRQRALLLPRAAVHRRAGPFGIERRRVVVGHRRIQMLLTRLGQRELGEGDGRFSPVGFVAETAECLLERVAKGT